MGKKGATPLLSRGQGASQEPSRLHTGVGPVGICTQPMTLTLSGLEGNLMTHSTPGKAKVQGDDKIESQDKLCK